MKEKIIKLFKSKIFIYIFLIIVILAQIIYFSCVFAFQKEGFHSDEMYSYGLSNSHRNPFLTIDGDIYSVEFKNVNEWISGDVLRDYLIVNDGEAFDYANVWYNQSLDRHPPLYYSVLHTVCSFFPNQFSPWFGFSVNIAVFVVLQIFLFLLAKKLFKSKWLAAIVCLCFGFSVGTVNVFIYIRMYAMLMMWVVIMAYIHTKLLDIKDDLKLKSLIPVTIVVMLGALTQHEFTIMAFVFAVMFCIRYLCKKQIENFFKYGISMASGVALAWAVFPPLMGQVFTESGSQVDMRAFFIQIRVSIENIFGELFGIKGLSDGDKIYYMTVIPVFIIVIVLFALPICFLFRKNEKFRSALLNFKNKFKEFPQTLKSFRPIKSIKEWLCRINFVYYPMLLGSLAIIIISAKSVLYYAMGYFDRYIFITFPYMFLIFMAIIICILSKIKPLKKHNRYKIASVIAMIAILINCNVNSSIGYLFKNEGMGDFKDLTKDSDCIVVELSKNFKWRLVCFTSELYDVDKIFYTSYDEIDNYIDKISSLKTDKPIYVFLTEYINGLEEKPIEEIVENYSNSFGLGDFKNIGSVTIFSLKYYVYRIQ